jgi:hypothetical protein
MKPWAFCQIATVVFTNGIALAQAGDGFSGAGANGPTVPVPEPVTFLSVGGALIGFSILGAAIRRRRSARLIPPASQITSESVPSENSVLR